jgi:hypothetical protein
MPYVDLRPDNVRRVQILTAAGWVEGDLEAYQRNSDGVWEGFVRWTTGLAETRIGWFEEGRIRTGQ